MKANAQKFGEGFNQIATFKNEDYVNTDLIQQ